MISTSFVSDSFHDAFYDGQGLLGDDPLVDKDKDGDGGGHDGSDHLWFAVAMFVVDTTVASLVSLPQLLPSS